MAAKLPRNIRLWEFISQDARDVVLCCRDCGRIHTFPKSALNSDYLVCEVCGA